MDRVYMKRGRPVGSQIRIRMMTILHYLGEGYGYQIHKLYRMIYGECTREVVYYNLRKGVSVQEFVEVEVKREKGNYSWGDSVEKIYYALGPDARIEEDDEAKRVIVEYKAALVEQAKKTD